MRALHEALQNFRNQHPFDHCVVDEFFEPDIARQLADEFPNYESPHWYVYNNKVEHKKALNNWERFPRLTYQAITLLQSRAFTYPLEEALGEELYVDHGLNGGGWHIHGTGGNLNPHLDYSIHPKMNKERVLNCIIYLASDLKPEYGGHLGFWEHDAQGSGPGLLVKEIEPRYNRAVIFNTTQNSWHGMSRRLEIPEGVYRKSLAVYYMREPAKNTDPRGRALFAPREDQKQDEGVLELIRLRSDVSTSSTVHRT